MCRPQKWAADFVESCGEVFGDSANPKLVGNTVISCSNNQAHQLTVTGGSMVSDKIWLSQSDPDL